MDSEIPSEAAGSAITGNTEEAEEEEGFTDLGSDMRDCMKQIISQPGLELRLQSHCNRLASGKIGCEPEEAEDELDE